MTTTHDRPDVLAYLMHGDLAALDDEQRLWVYLHECERMGLDPAARPLEFMTLSGRVVLYAKRIAGDMLAAKHRVSVVLVAGPEVRDFGGTKLFFAHARATLPDGRSVEDVATLPFADLANAVMKVTTKSFRRATLRLCGWGGLDQDELESIPAAPSNDLRHAPAPGEPEPEVLQRVRDDLEAFWSFDGDRPTIEQAAAVYAEHLAELGDAAHDGAALCRDACQGDKIKRPSMAAFRRAVDAELARRKSKPAPSPDTLLGAGIAAMRTMTLHPAEASPPAPDALAVVVSLLCETYHAARTLADVHEADATGKTLGLARDSGDYARVATTRGNAVARIRAATPLAPPARVEPAPDLEERRASVLAKLAAMETGDPAPDPSLVARVTAARELLDAMTAGDPEYSGDDPERDAIEAEEGFTVERDPVEPWDVIGPEAPPSPAHLFAAYLAEKTHPEAVANAFAAHWRESGVEESYARRLAVARWIATHKDPSKVSAMQGANALRGAETRRDARDGGPK